GHAAPLGGVRQAQGDRGPHRRRRAGENGRPTHRAGARPVLPADRQPAQQPGHAQPGRVDRGQTREEIRRGRAAVAAAAARRVRGRAARPHQPGGAMSKRWMLLLLVAGVAAGCGTLPSLTEPPKPEKVAAKEAKDTPAEPKVKRPTTLVTPEQVTDANAH